MQGKRTRLQVVMSAEDGWLKEFLIETDIYICPSEVTTGGKRHV